MFFEQHQSYHSLSFDLSLLWTALHNARYLFHGRRAGFGQYRLFQARQVSTQLQAAFNRLTEPRRPGRPQAKGLHQAMLARGRTWFGTALTIRDDPAEQAIISNTADFGSVTPENAMKWESTEPERGVFTFDDADAVVDFAKSNGQQIHCHTLVWHSQLAPWVEAGNFDNETLIQIMTDHIEAVAGRYKDVCTRWDVVNEGEFASYLSVLAANDATLALNENGTYRESVWYRTIGEAYIPLAFQITHRVAPQAELYYNDYNLEYGEDKTAGARRIVQLVKSYGAQIHGVGFQGHLASETTPTAPGPVPEQAVLTSSLNSLAQLGVDVAYTELDIRMNTPATPEKLQVQADAYARVAGSCMDVKRCVGITAWVSLL